jgi:hypothetical protein
MFNSPRYETYRLTHINTYLLRVKNAENHECGKTQQNSKPTGALESYPKMPPGSWTLILIYCISLHNRTKN